MVIDVICRERVSAILRYYDMTNFFFSFPTSETMLCANENKKKHLQICTAMLTLLPNTARRRCRVTMR